MTVPVELPRNDYVGNGVTTVFTFDFRADAAVEVKFRVGGVVLILGVDYTVDSFGPSGGQITATTAPPNLAAIEVYRQVPQEQSVVFSPYSGFPAKTTEEILDDVVRMVQDNRMLLSFVYGLVVNDDGDIEPVPPGQYVDMGNRGFKNVLPALVSDPTTVVTYGDLTAAIAAANAANAAQFADVAAPETISALWNFTVAPTINGSAILTAANHLTANPHSQYARHASAETIAGLWNFTTRPTFNGVGLATLNEAGGSATVDTLDAETLTVGFPTVGQGVRFTARTNVGNGLAKLNPQGKIPLSLSVLSLLNFLGVYNNSGANSGENPSEAFPGNTYVAGDAYVIGEDDGTTITLKDADTGLDYEQAVDPGDNLLYMDTADVPQAPATGWYYVARSDVTSAANVLYSNGGTSFTAVNVQDALDEVDSAFTRRDRAEAVNAAWTFNASIVRRDPVGTAGAMSAFISFQDGANVERGWVGFGEGNANFRVYNSIGGVRVVSAASFVEIATNGVSRALVDAPGNWTFNGAGFTFAAPQFTFSGNTLVLGGNAAGAATHILNTAAGAERDYRWNSAGVVRWIARVDQSETGANAGSDLAFLRYDDAGGFLGYAMKFFRATGEVVVNGSAAVHGQPGLVVNGLFSQVGVQANYYPGAGVDYEFVNRNGAGLRFYTNAANTLALTLDSAGNGLFAREVYLNGAAGSTEAMVAARAGGVNRWRFGRGSGAESGGNAGSSWQLQRYDDGGGFLGVAIDVNRANGVVTLENGLLTPTYVQANQTLYSGNTVVLFGTANGDSRGIHFGESTQRRWVNEKDGVAEGGGNAGSNWLLHRYDDAGSYLGTPISVNRATGVVNFEATPTIGGSTIGAQKAKAVGFSTTSASQVPVTGLALVLAPGSYRVRTSMALSFNGTNGYSTGVTFSGVANIFQSRMDNISNTGAGAGATDGLNTGSQQTGSGPGSNPAGSVAVGTIETVINVTTTGTLQVTIGGMTSGIVVNLGVIEAVAF